MRRRDGAAGPAAQRRRFSSLSRVTTNNHIGAYLRRVLSGACCCSRSHAPRRRRWPASTWSGTCTALSDRMRAGSAARWSCCCRTGWNRPAPRSRRPSPGTRRLVNDQGGETRSGRGSQGPARRPPSGLRRRGDGWASTLRCWCDSTVERRDTRLSRAPRAYARPPALHRLRGSAPVRPGQFCSAPQTVLAPGQGAEFPG